VAEQCGGHLGIENRRGHRARGLVHDFDVLARGMHDPFVFEQGFPECRLALVRQRVDAVNRVARRDLHEAQLRVVGALTHEFGVDADAALILECVRERIGMIDILEVGHGVGNRDF
jgi:hypothetical protein